MKSRMIRAMAAGAIVLGFGLPFVAQAATLKPKNANEATVLALLNMAFNQKKPDEAFAKYVGPTYTQHNPTVADGAKAAITSFKAFEAAVPTLHYDFKHIYSDGNFVIIHSEFMMKPSDPGYAVVDIFRLDKGKVVEHWDVGEVVPAKSANKNGMF